MPAGVINSDATFIPDEAEVWIALKADVPNIAALIPTDADDDLDALGWSHVGLLDEKKGINLNPSIEVKKFNAFGHPKFRVKLKNGELESGFTILEENEVTRQFVLPGSAANKIGAPKDVQIYVLYKVTDNDTETRIWVSLSPAPVEVKDHGGFVEGELASIGCVVHLTNNADGDAFQVVSGATAVSDYLVTLGSPSAGDFTLTYKGETTGPIAYNAAASAVRAALAALDDGYKLADWAVAGSAGGPYTITPPAAGAITGSGAGLTGGTFSVAPA